MTIRILNMWDLSPFPDILAPLNQIAQVDEVPASQTILYDRIGNYQGFLTPLNVQTNSKVLSIGHCLKVIATASTGTDHIDVSFALDHGISVLSLKNDTEFLKQITSTAELAWGLLLSLIRHLPEAIFAAKNGIWARDLYRGHQLSGKTLGIVGYGRLGSIVAEYGKVFGMKVLACDTRPVVVADDIHLVDFYTLLENSDVVTIHIHLTTENNRLFNSDAFAYMKPGAILINTSRGAILDEDAFLQALETKKIAGAGLDVIDGEWLENLEQHPLIQYARDHENLVITPHIGGVTHESQRMAYERIISKVVDYFLFTKD